MEKRGKNQRKVIEMKNWIISFMFSFFFRFRFRFCCFCYTEQNRHRDKWFWSDSNMYQRKKNMKILKTVIIVSRKVKQFRYK